MRAALCYLRGTGRIALVMPYAALSRRAYAAFRKGEVAQYRRLVFRLRFTGAWTFGPKVQALFPVPSCVLFAQVNDNPQPAPLPAQVTAFAGTLPRRDAVESEAAANLTETEAPWPLEASEQPKSPYRQEFRQGATLVPRRLVLVDAVAAAGRLPPNPVFPLVRGRTSNQDKKPWKEIEPPQGTVEREFLRPVLLGATVAPFRILVPERAVIPWDQVRGGLLDAEKAARRGYSHLAQWLEKTEKIWEQHKQSDLSHSERIDYHRELSCQLPIATIRVVYTKRPGPILRCCGGSGRDRNHRAQALLGNRRKPGRGALSVQHL